MPLLRTLNKSIKNESKFALVKEDDKSLNILIEKIVNKLVIEQASLIYDVDNGQVDNLILKEEIIKLIDQSNTFYFDRDIIIKKIFNQLFGYGILHDYIINENISDIDFTRYDHGVYKINGVKQKMPISFSSNKEFETYCKLIIIRNGGIINENDSHCRVSDENYRLRINVAIPPRNRTGPCLIIRKHRMNPYNLEDLEQLDMLTSYQKQLLENISKKFKYNYLICGKGAAGKTTLLRAMLMQVEIFQTILICEKDSELYLDNYPNFIIQKIKKKEEGGKSVMLKDLVCDGLTMSLDGICIGELISDEAWDFINAGYTDHKICGTLHARSPKDCIERLITMIDTASLGLSEKTIKTVINGAIDYIIYLKNFKIEKIVQVVNYDRYNDKFNFKDVSEGALS